jgi:hypothetical protein
MGGTSCEKSSLCDVSVDGECGVTGVRDNARNQLDRWRALSPRGRLCPIERVTVATIISKDHMGRSHDAAARECAEEYAMLCCNDRLVLDGVS